MAPLLTLILILLAAALAPIAGVDSRDRAAERAEPGRRPYNPYAD